MNLRMWTCLCLMFFFYAGLIYGVPATFPFFETFPDTVFSNVWERTSSGPEGKIVIIKKSTVDNDNYNAAVLTLNNGYPLPKIIIPTPNLNELTLSVAMTRQNNTYLVYSFYYSATQEWAMPERFEGHTNATGVAVSGDGQTWYRASDPATIDGSGRRRVAINLDSLRSRYGFNYTADFKIRFQQYSPLDRSYDNFSIDSVMVYTPVKCTTTISAAGNGRVVPGGSVSLLPGFQQPLSAVPGPGSGFAGWRVKNGRVTIDSWFNRTTSATIFSNASIEALFSERGRIFDVDTGGMMFQPLSHSFVPGGGDEIRFRCTAPENSRMGISLAGTNGITGLELICYGTDSSFSTITARCSGTTAANALKMALALPIGKTSQSYYFSVLTTSQDVFAQSYFVKMCRMFEVTFPSDSLGGADIPSFAGALGDSGFISAVPELGYVFNKWQVDSGSCIISTPDSKNTGIRITGDAVIRAGFKHPETFSLSTSTGEVKQFVLDRHVGSDTFNLTINCRETGAVAVTLKTRRGIYSSTPFAGSGDSGRIGQVGERDDYLTLDRIYSLPVYGCIAGKTRTIRVLWPSRGNLAAPPCTLTFSTASPVICTLAVSGNGHTVPEGVAETFAYHTLAVRAVPDNDQEVFSHWETTTPRECLMVDRWNSPGGFICSGNSKVTAVFVSRITHPLLVGTNRVVMGTTVGKPEIRTLFTAPAPGRYAIAVNSAVTVKQYTSGFSGSFSSTILQGNFQNATVLHATTTGESFRLGMVTIADTLPFGELCVHVDSVYHLEMAAAPGGRVEVAGGEWIARNKVATIAAKASTGYTFSGWHIDSGTALLTDSKSPVTTASILSDVKCTPLFTKCGPVELHEGNQTILGRDLYNGLEPKAALLLAFTAPALGWYKIFQHTGIHWSAEPVMLSYFGSDSTFTGRDVVSDFTPGEICFYAEKGARQFFKVQSTRNSTAWSGSAYFGITVSKRSAITVAPTSGGRLLPSPSVFLCNNDTLFLNAGADSGYVFDAWSISGQTAAVYDSNYSQCKVIPSGPITIAARFTIATPVLLTSTAQPVRTSGDPIIMKFIPPAAGSYALILDSTSSNRVTYFGEDSTRTRPIYSTSERTPLRFQAVQQNVPHYFISSNTATPLNRRFFARVVPVFECRIVSNITTRPRPSEFTFASPDVPLAISSGYYGRDYSFVAWELLAGRGSIEHADTPATMIRAQSDIVIMARFTPLVTHEVRKTPTFINLAESCKNTAHLKLSFKADTTQGYTLCISYPAGTTTRGTLTYFAGDSLRTLSVRSVARTSPSTELRLGFNASAANESHYFMLDSYTYLPTDSIKLWVENAPTAVTTADTTTTPSSGFTWNKLSDYGQTDIPFTTSGQSPAEPFGSCGFSLTPSTPAYYSVQVASYPSFVEMDMLQFGADSTFSTVPVITRLDRYSSSVVVDCRSGNRQFIVFRRADATAVATGRVDVKVMRRFYVGSGPHGTCSPLVDSLLPFDSRVNLSAFPDSGYDCKGWFAVKGTDTLQVSQNAQFELRFVSDTILVALFTPQEVITLTQADSAIMPLPNRDFRNQLESSMMFRFVPEDTGRYALTCTGQPYVQSASLYYQHDSTFTSIVSYSTYNDSGYHEHIFSVTEPGVPCYFRLGSRSSSPVNVSVKRGYTIHLVAGEHGSAGPAPQIIIPRDGSYHPKIVATPDNGYRLAAWHVTEGQITLADSLARSTRVTVSSSGTIDASFAKGKVYQLTDTATGYNFQRDYYTMHPDSGVCFVFTPHDTGWFSAMLPFAATGQNTYLNYYGNDSACVKGFPLKQVTGSIGDGVINFCVTDTSLRYYFLVNGYHKSDSMDFTIKSARPCTLTVENADHGVLKSPAQVILPPGATSIIRLLPDTGYRVEYWDVVEGMATFNDTTRQNPVVTVAGSCTLRPRLQKCAPYPLPAEKTKFTFEQNGYSIPPDRREIKFMYVAPSDDSLTVDYNTYSTCGCGAFSGQVRSTTGVLFSWGSSSLYRSFWAAKGDTLYLSVINQSSMNPLTAVDTLLRGWFDIRMVVKDSTPTAVKFARTLSTTTVRQPELITVASNPARISGKQCSFIAQSTEASSYSLTLFDRVGNRVMHTTGKIPRNTSGRPFFTWNLQDESGRVVAPGTYLAVATFTFNNGRTESVKAPVGVVR